MTPYRDGSFSASASGVFDQQPNVVTWSQTATFTNNFGEVVLTGNGTYSDADQIAGDPLVHFGGKSKFRGVQHPKETSIVIAGLQVTAIVFAVGADTPEVLIISGLGFGYVATHTVAADIHVDKRATGIISTDTAMAGTTGPYVSPFPDDYLGLTAATYPGIMVHSASQLSGVPSDPTMFVNGVDTLRAIPEPPSWSAFACGAAICIVRRLVTRRARESQNRFEGGRGAS
jgi:hypothetical protein